MLAGGLFNTFAFTGPGYLFKMINSDGYSEEIKRHNLAMEQLTRVQQKWNQKKIEEEIRVCELRREKLDANEDFSNINKSLKNYKKVMEIIHGRKKFARKSHLWDLYAPSEEMPEYMTLTIGAMGLVSGWTGEKIISRLV